VQQGATLAAPSPAPEPKPEASGGITAKPKTPQSTPKPEEEPEGGAGEVGGEERLVRWYSAPLSLTPDIPLVAKP